MRDPETILITLSTFFIALLAGLLFSALFRRFRIPWAVTLIFGGVIIGPHALGLIQLENNPVIWFLAEIGVIFLMFLAGMEIRFSAIRDVLKEGAIVGVFTGIVPGVLGAIVVLMFGYSPLVALTIGIILINTSFAVVVPSLESKGILQSRVGKIIVSSTVLQDISSLVIFAVFLQIVNPTPFLPLPLWVVLLLFTLAGGIFAKFLIPRMRKPFKDYEHKHHDRDLFEGELRTVMIFVLGFAIIFEFFKFETIVGAFFAGLIISEATKSKMLDHKLHILGYGIFIPIFFVVVGAWIDISLFTQKELWLLIAAIALTSMTAKFVSGWTSGRLVGLDNYESSLVGLTSVPQLITTLALTAIAQSQGLIPDEIAVAVIVLAIVSVIVGPLIMGRVLDMKYPDRD